MSKLIIVGDRVLIEPQDMEQETEAGLVLPATVTAREEVRTGRVVRVGPGYVMPNPEFSEGETWKQSQEAVRYLPLQAAPGDHAFFVAEEAIEMTYENKDYFIIPHAAILALLRPDSEDNLNNIEGLEDLDL